MSASIFFELQRQVAYRATHGSAVEANVCHGKRQVPHLQQQRLVGLQPRARDENTKALLAIEIQPCLAIIFKIYYKLASGDDFFNPL